MRKTILQLSCVTFLLLSCIVLGMGCGDNDFQPVGNEPPETGLAITGAIDTTFYTINMKWWGSDPDGEVSGFHYRWIAPTGAEVFDLDTVWTFTGFTTKKFNMPVPDSSAAYTFQVRAVDDQGAVDESPAEQTYPFYNNPPFGEIRFKELLPDSSWPVIAFGWNSYDPDGDSTIAANIVWIGGQEDRVHELPGDVDTITLTPAELDSSGDVTIFFQTIDQGYAAGPIDSFNIHLFEVKGSVLLVDDYNKLSVGVVDADGFYEDLLTERYGEDGFTILDLARRPFDTDVRFEAFLSVFDEVIWYSGHRQRARLQDADRFDQMTLVDSVMSLYIREEGGHLFLSSLNAVGTFGGFGPRGSSSRHVFLQDVLGIQRLYINRESGGTNHFFRQAEGSDPLYSCTGTMIGMEGTGLPDLELACGDMGAAPRLTYDGIDSPDTTGWIDAELLYRLPAGVLKNQQLIIEDGDTELVDSFFIGDSLIATDTLIAVDDTVGVSFYPAFRREFPSGGKVVCFTFPFYWYSGADNNDDVFTTMLDWFGETPRKR